MPKQLSQGTTAYFQVSLKQPQGVHAGRHMHLLLVGRCHWTGQIWLLRRAQNIFSIINLLLE